MGNIHTSACHQVPAVLRRANAFMVRRKFRQAWTSLALIAFAAASSSPLLAQLHPGSFQGRELPPAGELVIDRTTQSVAVGAMGMNIVRSPDHMGPDGAGRYLVVVCSGYGVRFDDDTNGRQQSLQVIDLALEPPQVVQNVYFPSPQSASVGAVFDPRPLLDGSYRLYVSGGFENKVWMLTFDTAPDIAGEPPIRERSDGPNTHVEAPTLSLEGFARQAPSPRYNASRAPVYPLGLALSADYETLYVANNLADSLGIVRDLRGRRDLESVDLRSAPSVDAQPYDVVAVTVGRRPRELVFVSLWATGEVVRVDPRRGATSLTRIKVARHPTKMLASRDGTRLFVVCSNADAVSVIDTAEGREIERIPTSLAEGSALLGASPEGLALSADGRRLYAANAHAAALAVIELSSLTRGAAAGGDEKPERDADGKEEADSGWERLEASQVIGFVPTGLYPSAVAVANGLLFVANGKGTGFESSSQNVTTDGLFPNAPNAHFPVRDRRPEGQDIKSLVAGNLSVLPEPEGPALLESTQDALRANGLLGERRASLFDGPSPIRHVIYVIKENRTYDQVFGDLAAAGDGTPADGDPALAIFGEGEAARLLGDAPQRITPNQRALALRFGLLDRFFVNAEASPDGHNWSTAAFSTDYVDKAFRWNYGGRGRTYDFEGFNRLPATEPRHDVAPLLPLPVTAEGIGRFLERYIPYRQGGRDVSEPDSLYLWDAAQRAGLSTRNYGEFVATVSQEDVDAFNRNRAKRYPDVSPTLLAVPTKRSLEHNYSPEFRNFDLETPDVMTVASYEAALASGRVADAIVAPERSETPGHGVSRFAVWRRELHGYVEDLQAGRGDHLPNLSIVRLSSNHTAGLSEHMPTPQFMVADNDLAVGLLVQELSHSPYWRDTAVVVVEDDAQDGPDHVDGHRSPALVISAYNRPGALVHEIHNTVSAVRTIEVLLGIEPMNALDAAAVPIDIFQSQPDLTPFDAVLPQVAENNLMNPQRRTADARTRYFIDRSAELNLAFADLADPAMLNRILWFSVRGDGQLPAPNHLPLFAALRYGLAEEAEEDEQADPVLATRLLLASRGAAQAARGRR